jgi:magnesium chelatase subunit D
MTPPDPWHAACLAASLLALDPAGLGGAVLRARPGPLRDRWVARLRACLPAGAPLRRLPLHADDGRLLGGIDLAATLGAGRPVLARGVLAEADGGVVLAAMAERLGTGSAARLAAVLDAGAVVLARDGLAATLPARIGVVALDEGLSEEEGVPEALRDRLGLLLDLDAVATADAGPPLPDMAAARARLGQVETPADAAAALCAAALALGVASLRAPLLALRVARAAAALAGSPAVTETELAVAAQLVLAPRATRLPPPPPQDAPAEPPAEPPPPAEGTAPLADSVVAAAAAALPPGLLARLAAGMAPARAEAGRAGAMQRGAGRGRPIGVRAGSPGGGARLDVLETLKAAAPWQRLRPPPPAGARMAVRRADLRIRRVRRHSASTTIFVLDASGSAALHRLAEAKGAVELLLAAAYVRRAQVALIAFRGREAELLLPPTGALARARRSLAGLPGGGGTPLAAAVDAAGALATVVRRRGAVPFLVFLTDGRANIARDGTAGRARAEAEALEAAKALRAAGLAAALIDVAPRPGEAAARLAAAMGASYAPLPGADAAALARTVQALRP